MNRTAVFYEHILEASAQTGKSTEEILKEVRGYGIDGLDCDLWRLEDIEQVKPLFEDCGFKVISTYNFYDFGHDNTDESVKKIHHQLELTAGYGAEKMLAVPGFIREGDDPDVIKGRMCELLNVMCEAARDYKITVTLEDFDDCNAPYSTISGLEYFMKNVDGLKYTFDTGNFAYSLESAEEGYERLKEHIVHVHLKDRSFDTARASADDSNGKADLSGKIMYPSEVCGGYIGIEKLVKRLLSDGYGGVFSIEHFGASDQLMYMKKSAENINKLLKGD